MKEHTSWQRKRYILVLLVLLIVLGLWPSTAQVSSPIPDIEDEVRPLILGCNPSDALAISVDQTYWTGVLQLVDDYFDTASYGSYTVHQPTFGGTYELPNTSKQYQRLPLSLAVDCLFKAEEAGVTFWKGDKQIHNVVMLLFPNEGSWYQSDRAYAAYRGVYITVNDKLASYGVNYFPGTTQPAMGTVAHEIGHSLGWSDIYPITPTPMDLMGDYWKTGIISPQSIDPIYGQMPGSPNLYHRTTMGWIDYQTIAWAEPDQRSRFFVSCLEDKQPYKGTNHGVRIPMADTGHTYYLLEVRCDRQHDYTWLPDIVQPKAVVLWQVSYDDIEHIPMKEPTGFTDGNAFLEVGDSYTNTEKDFTICVFSSAVDYPYMEVVIDRLAGDCNW